MKKILENLTMFGKKGQSTERRMIGRKLITKNIEIASEKTDVVENTTVPHTVIKANAIRISMGPASRCLFHHHTRQEEEHHGIYRQYKR